MIIETRAVPPFLKNGYVVGCEETREGVVIDPGDEVDALLDIVTRERLVVRYILLTHAHLDHVTGVARAKRALEAPVGLHRADLVLYNAVVEQGRAFGFAAEPQPAPDFFFDQTATADAAAATPRAKLRFGNHDIHVHHTPGHSPGGVCLQVVPAGTPSLTSRPSKLFVGDTLFAGSVGRTDLPGGDTLTLMKSIREVLFKFPDDCEVYSGHGPVTTIGHEKRTNPFLLAVM
jgi:glyoxylase-like metal-dependent hydrolase (beta-lactamase superfamily II)